jgi:hypothetical protein
MSMADVGTKRRQNIERIWKAALRWGNQPVTAELIWGRLPAWLRETLTPADLLREYPQLAQCAISAVRSQELAAGKFYISPDVLPKPVPDWRGSGRKMVSGRDNRTWESAAEVRRKRTRRLLDLYEKRQRVKASERHHVEQEIRRLRRKLSLENRVWDEFEKLVPVDRAAAMELIYTSVAEPHYEP